VSGEVIDQLLEAVEQHRRRNDLEFDKFADIRQVPRPFAQLSSIASCVFAHFLKVFDQNRLHELSDVLEVPIKCSDQPAEEAQVLVIVFPILVNLID